MSRSYEVFVNTGFVANSVLREIARKIKLGGIELTTEEISIYKAKAEQIEEIIKSI